MASDLKWRTGFGWGSVVALGIGSVIAVLTAGLGRWAGVVVTVFALVSVRNALETLLLLELLSLRTELCESWSQGKEIKPAAVRKYLAELSTAEADELVITVSQDEYADAKVAYTWLSQITHANLESMNHATTRVDENSWVLHIGGARFSVQARALTKILGVSFLRALVNCTAVHAPQLLTSGRARFTKLKHLVAAISTSGDANDSAKK
jgi:hypothetical protein